MCREAGLVMTSIGRVRSERFVPVPFIAAVAQPPRKVILFGNSGPGRNPLPPLGNCHRTRWRIQKKFQIKQPTKLEWLPIGKHIAVCRMIELV